ncbi:hypothetical protein DUI87_10569 [Hirundo rustica rustica]|uniref:Uncharacterized protein n=1 Tax=Hirundo rustica rustica TaxID=333673 RepID=A0A3M0KIH4_HIRRU|nr:hypothetical protein DUI87_10569 [Hirundo rustica rustica]
MEVHGAEEQRSPRCGAVPGGPQQCSKEAVTLWKPSLEQALGRTWGTMERGTHNRAALLGGLVAPWNIPTGAGGPEVLKDCTPQKEPTGTACEELKPVGRTHVGEVGEGLPPMRGAGEE